MKIMDNAGREVIHLEAPLRCDTCWFPCCLKVLVDIFVFQKSSEIYHDI